jgi:DNA-binding FadR family transcriptional regulator
MVLAVAVAAEGPPARAFGNPLFVAALQMVDCAMREGIRLAQVLARLRNDEPLALVQKERAAIVDAIAEQAPERAAAAMRHHLEMSRRRLIGRPRA